MRAEIIAIGSELLTPSRVDTNSLFITEKLNGIGIAVVRKSIVGDQSLEIRDVFSGALLRSEIVVLIGGLGPTNDDITREVVAELLGRPLHLNDFMLQNLIRRYDQARLKMTDNNRRQAMVPEGAEILENPSGTAPGLFLKEKDALIFLLPGPPQELKPMVVNHVVPRITQLKPIFRQFYRHLKIGSEFESRVDAWVGPVYKEYSAIETTILASPGIIELFFYWHGEKDESVANQQLDALTDRIRSLLGDSVITDKEESLESVVGRLLRERRKTVATAESCTGGIVGKMITDVSGSSEYYRGGVVCYSNDLKIDLAGVNETTLERYGSVSEPIAHQLAVGIRRQTGADYGLAVTGIAGPGGGTAEKPVGLVFIALSAAAGTEVRRLQLRGDRETIRLRAARTALDWLRRKLQLADR